MPMLLMSGAFFPIDSAHAAMRWIMYVNPLAYGVGAMRHTINLGIHPETAAAATAGLPSLTVCLAVTVGFAVAMFALGTAITLRRTARDAQ